VTYVKFVPKPIVSVDYHSKAYRLWEGGPGGVTSPCWAPWTMVDKMGGGGRTFPRGRLIPGLPRGDNATTGLYRRSI
jgi:hypothetical protein